MPHDPEDRSPVVWPDEEPAYHEPRDPEQRERDCADDGHPTVRLRSGDTCSCGRVLAVGRPDPDSEAPF